MKALLQKLDNIVDSNLLQRLFVPGFLVVNVLYLLHLVLLAWFNHLAADDWCFVYAYNEHGFFDSFGYWYNNWQGRVSAYVLINSVLAARDVLPSLFIYQLFLMGLFVFGFYQTMRIGLKKLGVEPGNMLLLAFAVNLLNLFVFFQFDFTTFYWLNVSTMYFAGVAFAVIGLASLLHSQNTIWTWLGTIIGFGWACCSSENFGLICLGFLFLNLVGHIALVRKLPLRHAVAFVVGSIMFVVMFMAPGNSVRQETMPDPSFITTLKVSAASFYHFLFYSLRPRLGEFLVLVLPMIYFGTRFRSKDTTVQPGAYSSWLLIAALLFFVFLFFTMIPTSYALSARGPARALTHISFYFVAFLAVAAFLLGLRTLFSEKAALALGFVGIWTLGFFAIKGLAWNVPETAHYSRDEAKKIAYLESLKGEVEPGSLVPVRQSYYQPGVVIMVNKVVREVGGWHNRCLPKGMQLGFDVYGVRPGEEMPPITPPEDNPVTER